MCDLVSEIFFNFLSFWNILYKYHFYLVELAEEKFPHQALFDASGEDSLKEASCKISTKADNYFKSYAIL